MNQELIILASASPRRASLLQQLGVRFVQKPADIDESALPLETPEEHVARLAFAKCENVLASRDDSVILGSDTVVSIDNKILGKPRDQEHHADMMAALSGVTHSVFTAVTLMTKLRIETAVNTSFVRFRKIQDQEIVRYWHSGEPQDKAGGYAIQGYGAAFVEHLSGSYSAVMGLPLFETAQLLERFEVPFWRSEGHS